MLPGTFNMQISGAGSSSAVLTYRGYKASTNSEPTYTFGSQSVGTGSSDRYVVAVVASENQNIEPTSVKYGTITLTRIVGTTGGDGKVPISIYGGLVTAGTSLTITVEFSTRPNTCTVFTYTITGLQSTTPVDTGSDQHSGAGGVTGVSSQTLTCDVGSVVIAGVNIKDTSTAITWSGGVTENQEVISTDSMASVASGAATSGSITPAAAWVTEERYGYAVAAWS